MSYIDFVAQLMSDGVTREAAEARAGAAYGHRSHASQPKGRHPRAYKRVNKTVVLPDDGGEHPFPGVSWHRRDRRWRAEIRVEGLLIYLGYHGTAERAREAVEGARRKGSAQ
jgi:hypothetical protein